MTPARTILPALLVCALTLVASGQQVEYATLDRMFVKVDTPVHAIVGSGQIKFLAYHSYPTSLHHFKVVAKSDCLDVTVEPREMEAFKPTTIESFVLHLTIKGQPTADRVPLSVGMTADELRSDKQFMVTVPLTKQAEKEVNDALAIHAGEIEVYVRRFGEEIYYLYVIPTLALLAWLFWRKRRVTQVGTEE